MFVTRSMVLPTFIEEQNLAQQGYVRVAGVDEVGYGALAGPLVAAAVILPFAMNTDLIRDSKTLSPSQRDRVYERIVDQAIAVGIGEASVTEINQLNIRVADALAMRRALEQIEGLDFALVDGFSIPFLSVPQRSIIHGDGLVLSIAAASIVAKVTRDRMMKTYHEEYPMYAFDKHKGYGTAMHQAAIKTHGPCPLHRISWKCFDTTSRHTLH